MNVENNSSNPAKEGTTKNILAYFKSPEEANKVQEKLKDLGVSDIQVDRFNKYPLGSADQLMNPLTGDTPSQATLTLGINAGQDTGILVSTDVSATGMSDGGQNPITGRDIILGTVVDESIFEKARLLIKEGDGVV
ncbi:hypothetical protein [Desulfosporosinus sp. Sb-LF]|uniref:hypothetical protein n=1 Tax=Desulfosporosinus sp. Sb-LF TaxID=2560027 RepID=UPI00107F95A7|nr:hypothetical protein [Desulfosporosinus sp. Sb-LF]TGE32027.1 hypothetical protein E4K68_12910 [Desulfosporosinus sp. Sb-LF]